MVHGSVLGRQYHSQLKIRHGSAGNEEREPLGMQHRRETTRGHPGPAQELSLEIIAITPTATWAKPTTGCDYRILEAVTKASNTCDVEISMRTTHHLPFDAQSEVGQNACKVAARVIYLRQRLGARTPRFDDDGLQEADVEILSMKPWKAWIAKLTASKRGALRLWRVGGVVTPTRMAKVREPTCTFCGQTNASARHL